MIAGSEDAVERAERVLLTIADAGHPLLRSQVRDRMDRLEWTSNDVDWALKRLFDAALVYRPFGRGIEPSRRGEEYVVGLRRKLELSRAAGRGTVPPDVQPHEGDV